MQPFSRYEYKLERKVKMRSNTIRKMCIILKANCDDNYILHWKYRDDVGSYNGFVQRNKVDWLFNSD